MSTLAEVVRDLADEQAALDARVAGLPDERWEVATPSEGWRVRDQITHLAYFDRVAALAITDPEPFAAEVATALQDFAGYEARYVERGRALAPADLLAWWRSARRDLLAAAAGLDDKARVPWYGPSMSAVSFVTARLMECWLHGHDVVDALGLERAETDRLRHVAFLGTRSRSFSYVVRGLAPRTDPVRVELTLPSGAPWADGDEGAASRIAGTAVDFCRVVTHRRHVADTDLRVEGAAADEWMRIAQAFAGPPAPGRRPGQFPKRRQGA